ncbi:MAG TPA: gamma-glutamyltransferase [Gemmatimonadales bacterium]
MLAFATACGAPQPPAAPAPAFSKRVEGRNGMVSASHPDAAAAGLEILKAGGNAVDAALAVAFALGVVDPSQTGLGGGGGLVYWNRAARRGEAIDFYARTGSDSAWARVDTAAVRQPINVRAAGIPGTVAGMLDAHARWGRLPRAQVIAPAIRLARDGFTVSPLLARTTESSRTKLSADSAAAQLFYPGGQPVRTGERLVQAELARTLEAIAAGGADAFYRGPLAERAVEKLRAMGSPVTLADWQAYRAEAKRPLCSPWRDHTLLAAPAPLGGVVPLAALNLLAQVQADTLGSPTVSGDAAMTMVAALRVAEADRRRWRGDPAVFGVPARGMASPAFAVTRVAAMATAPSDPVPPGDPWPADGQSPGGRCDLVGSWPASARGPAAAALQSPSDTLTDDAAASFTSHFSVVDRDRNAVAVTFTVGVLFGSGVYVNGYFLNSGANNFDGQTRGPNRFASSTIAPTIVLRGDDVRLVIGAAGSQYIPTAVTQVAFRTLALGEDPWLAIAAPRLQPARRNQVEVEAGFSPQVYAALRNRGYLPVSRVGDILFGGVHAIVLSDRGTLVGVADPRRDGAAMGW